MWLDSLILAAHQKIADAVQWATGKSCYWLAMQSAIGYVVMVTVAMWMSGGSVPNRIFLTVIIAVFYLGHAESCRRLDARWRAQPDVIHRWPDPPIIRMIIVLIIGLIVVGVCVGPDRLAARILWTVSQVLLLALNYFRDCVPKPPATVRERKRWGRLSPVRVNA